MVVFSGTSVLLVVLTVLSSPHLQIRVVGEEIIKRLANFSADPCEDFIKYSCGNFLSVYPNPKRGDTWTVASQLAQDTEKKYKELFKSQRRYTSTAVSLARMFQRRCMLEWQTSPALIEIIDEFGCWPLYPYNDWSCQRNFNKVWNFAEALLTAAKYQAFPFFTIDYSQTNLMIKLERPKFTKSLSYDGFDDILGRTLGAIIKTYKESDANNFQATYNELMMNMSNLAEYVNAMTQDDPPSALKNLTRMWPMAVYRTIWKINKTEVSGVYHDLTEDGIKILEDMHDMEKELKELPAFGSETVGINGIVSARKFDKLELPFVLNSYFDTQISNDTLIFFDDKNYFSFLVSVLEKYTKRTVASYIIWTVLDNLVDIGPRLDSSSDSMFEMCAKETIEKFPHAVSRMYADQHLNNIKHTFVDIANRIRTEASQQKLVFYDNETQRRFGQKSNKTKFSLLYSDFVLNDTELDKLYQPIEANQDYVIMRMKHAIWLRNRQRMALQGIRDQNYWKKPPDFLNAITYKRLNQIHIYSGYANKPFFYYGAPLEVHYGSIGRLLGHELGHTLIFSGMDFDGDGIRTEWATAWSRESLMNSSRCFEGFYNNLRMFGRRINGRIVSKECMSDSIGVFLAYKALQRLIGDEELEKKTSFASLNLTRAQTFFLSAAQIGCSKYYRQTSRRMFDNTHTFRSIRVKGFLQNSQEFAKAFNCKVGSTYNPENKCLLY